jgi:CheY-like chemotaxis protein
MAREKILIVDDSEIVRDTARLTLERAGYTVITADTPIGVSSLVRKESPDLLMVDVSMPALTGDRLVRLLRDKLGKPTIRIVLFSNRPEAELRHLLTTSGADGFIRKTGDESQLVRDVERILSAVVRTPSA